MYVLHSSAWPYQSSSVSITVTLEVQSVLKSPVWLSSPVPPCCPRVWWNRCRWHILSSCLQKSAFLQYLFCCLFFKTTAKSSVMMSASSICRLYVGVESVVARAYVISWAQLVLQIQRVEVVSLGALSSHKKTIKAYNIVSRFGLAVRR